MRAFRRGTMDCRVKPGNDSSRADMTQATEYDYVIVGAGSAGCVLANRLSADPSVSVLVLEAGPEDNNLFIHMPLAFSYALGDERYNWFYKSEPEPFLDNRQIKCPRGRVIGGSSSINGMVYIRGHALDYDNWARNDLPEWSYAHVLPYFKKAETRAKGADDYRGGEGPLEVATGPCENPLFNAFIEAGRQAGLPYTKDTNGYQQEGVGPWDMTVGRGRRCSAARAHLHPARRRPNLTVIARTLATRILFEGRRAVGVEYARDGAKVQARARAEVIVSGGAINSPHLLMLSGVGPADALRALGIDVIHDLPGVGQNLQDHIEIYVQMECTQPITLYSATKPLAKLKIGFDWLFLRRGVGASNGFEAGGFARGNTEVAYPNLQFHFLPVAVSYDGSASQDRHGFQLHAGPMRPTSRGSVTLRSADPKEPPSILFNYLQTEHDRREVREGLRWSREIFAQSAFAPFRGQELAPGAAVTSDQDIDAFVRANVESAFHPSSTCKMGTDDMAVVDGTTRVRGLENLRVIDASIMPAVVSGNLNAPTIMIAEKAADIVLGRTPLTPEYRPFHVGGPGPIKHANS